MTKIMIGAVRLMPHILVWVVEATIWTAFDLGEIWLLLNVVGSSPHRPRIFIVRTLRLNFTECPHTTINLHCIKLVYFTLCYIAALAHVHMHAYLEA